MEIWETTVQSSQSLDTHSLCHSQLLQPIIDQAGYPSAFYCTLNTHYRIASYRIANPCTGVHTTKVKKNRKNEGHQSPSLHLSSVRPRCWMTITIITITIFTSNKGGSKCVCPRLSVCLLARLLKNACMDLDEMLHVDRCLDMDELINFWAQSGL